MSEQTGRFGTFAGVFTPNVLTILGIILFLRTGWVVGQAGLWGALAIVAIASVISLLTGLSLSAVATSLEVKAGGNYYLISRSLGLEVGGAIGIPLYLSQAISVAFYIIGFTEAILAHPAVPPLDGRLVASVTVLVFGLVAWIGADFALRIQFVILGILVLALISFFGGSWDSIGAPLTEPTFTDGLSFWAVFAVFFPAVTGIEVGTSLSGDLKDPERSIPRGTIASIIVTSGVYALAVVWFAIHGTAETLINDQLAMEHIALWPGVIVIGVIASTLSSALGSVLAAPRTLQAIAADSVVPKWITSRLGSPTEPRAAVLVTSAIALGIIWLGDLNAVATIITMFFLNTYGMVNLTAGIEKLVGNPSFRPRYKLHWGVSLMGALGCYGAMFLISPVATLVAIAVSYGIYVVLKQRQLRRTWGDVRSGIWFALARFALLELHEHRPAAKNWRPNLLVFTGQPFNREHLVRMSDWLSQGQGIVTFVQLVIGNVEELTAHHMGEVAERHIRQYIREHDMKAFGEAQIVSDFKEGAIAVAQSHGIGVLEANTVLLGWSRTPEGRCNQMELLHNLAHLGKSTLFLNMAPGREFGARRTIDVWWGGGGKNADLMLLLAHVIRSHPDWEDCQLRLVRVIHHEEGRQPTYEHMAGLMRALRIEAEPVIVVAKPSDVAERLAETSRSADLTIIGMGTPEPHDYTAYSESLHALTQSVGSVLLVHNAQPTDLLDADQ